MKEIGHNFQEKAIGLCLIPAHQHLQLKADEMGAEDKDED